MSIVSKLIDYFVKCKVERLTPEEYAKAVEAARKELAMHYRRTRVENTISKREKETR
jgi:hypothetical protein